MLYYGPHLCRALTCLRAGYPENAASWMARDIAESSNEYIAAEQPDPKTLAETSFNGMQVIEYQEFSQTADFIGEAI